MPKYVPYRKIREQYEIGSETIRNWAKKGRINYRTIQNDQRKTWLYDIESIGKYVEQKEFKAKDAKDGYRILYARVSSQKQKADLQRQIKLLQGRYPDSEVISDIGSGLNYKRPGFFKLVEKVCRREVSEIVVTYRDRLARFGYELFNQVCRENGCRVVVLGQDLQYKGETQELQEDLLSIVNVFVARRNGRRAGQLRKERAQQSKKGEATSKPSSKN